MSIYNKTNYYSTIGDTVYYTDLGQVFHDLSYGNFANGVKTFAIPPICGNNISLQNTIFQSQTVNKNYIDSLTTSDSFYNITYGNFTKSMNVYANQVTSLLLNVTTIVPTNTFITQGNILTVMDTSPNGDQIYTFGTSQSGLWIAGGQGYNTMGYSYDGINWYGMPSSPFTNFCNAVAWNGTIWVAMGNGTNSLAYSYDGFFWIGLGNNLIQINTANFTSPYGCFAWNGCIWVAVANTAAPSGNGFLYSYDGINWIPNGYGGLPVVAGLIYINVYWNGILFVAAGGAASPPASNLVYSYNGIQWFVSIPVSTTSATSAVTWNGTFWTALGNAQTTLYTSYDGINWASSQGSVPSMANYVSCILTNGQICVAGSANSLTNYMIFSNDGLLWYANNSSIFANGVNNLAWNGTMWIACTRGGSYTLAYSYNGINWYGCYNPQGIYSATNIFSTNCFCAAWSGRRENLLYFPQNKCLLLGVSNTAGNTIAYSFDGSANWIPSLYSTNTWNTYNTARSPWLFSSANGADWNGYMWVAGGTINTAPYYTSGNTMTSGLNFTANATTGSLVSYLTSGTLFVNSAPSAYTLEAMIKIPTTGGNQQTMGFIGIPNSGIGMATFGTNFYLGIPGNVNAVDNYPLNDGNWHHVALSVSSGVANGSSFYIDGVKRPNSFTVTTTAVNSPFCVGTISTTSGLTAGSNFIGYISEVRIWNIALAGNTIAGQWNSNVNPASTGLVAYYSYYPTTGTIVSGTTFPNLATTTTIGALTAVINTNAITYDTTNKPTQNIAFYNFTPSSYYPQHTLAYSTIYGNSFLGNSGNVFIGMGNYTFSISVNNIKNNGNVWVAAGQGGNTLGYSPDGFTWFGLRNRVFNWWCNSLAWNGTYWVAVGGGPSNFTGNTIAYSPDGVQWTGLGNAIFAVSGEGICWNGTYWVAVGYSGVTGSGNTMAISIDGITWTGLGTTTFTTQGNDIATNNTGTMWVACGNSIPSGNSVAWSYNGSQWFRSQTGNNIFNNYCKSATWNGRYFIAVGAGGSTGNSVAFSADGNIYYSENPSVNYNNTNFIYANRVVWNGNEGIGYPIIKTNYTTSTGGPYQIWLAGGNNSITNGNMLAYSYNTTSWFPMGPRGGRDVFSGTVNNITYNGNYWIISAKELTINGRGNTLAYVTPNNMTTSGLGDLVFNLSCNYSSWNGIMWVAVGGNGNTIAYSYNGTTWIGLGAGIFTTQGTSVTWQGTYWLACGQGTNTLAYSYNGINWTGLGNYTFTNNATSAIWNGFMWVATGDSAGSSTGNTLAYSYNGITWIGTGSTTFTTLANGSQWNGKLWVAVGQGGNSIAYSYTGNIWLPATNNGRIFSYAGSQVSWNGNSWTAVGTSGINNGNTVAYSLNGNDWVGLGTTIFSNSGNCIATNNIFGNKIQLSSLNQPQLPYRSLDIVGDNYYQAGYNGVTLTIKTTGTGYPAQYTGY